MQSFFRSWKLTWFLTNCFSKTLRITGTPRMQAHRPKTCTMTPSFNCSFWMSVLFSAKKEVTTLLWDWLMHRNCMLIWSACKYFFTGETWCLYMVYNHYKLFKHQVSLHIRLLTAHIQCCLLFMNCYPVHRWIVFFLFYNVHVSLGKYRVWEWAWTMREKRKNYFLLPPPPPSISGQEILLTLIFLCTVNSLLRGNRGLWTG